MNSNYRILVAHPAMQHSFHTAAALKKEGLLFRYVTSVYDKKGSLTHILTKFLRKDFKIKMQAHRSSELQDNDVIQFCELESLFLLLLRRIDKNKKIVDKINMFIVSHFNKKVVRYVKKNHVDAVILYDTLALEVLKKLKKSTDVVCILDMSAPEANYMDQIFKHDIERHKEISGSLIAERNTAIYKKRLEIAADEVALADCFLVASSFTRKSLLACGVEENKIIFCQYGIHYGEEENFSRKSTIRDANDNYRLKCIFIGNVTQKKGIYNIFRMIQNKDCDDFSFCFVGAYDKTDCYIERMQEKCEFTGHVTKTEVQDRLARADVLIFPTLCDGFGFVVLEALHAGVPVICSVNAGACDIIVQGINGFIIKPGDIDQMYEWLRMLYKNRNMLECLKANAKETAKKYTWENYQIQLCMGVRHYLDKVRYAD